MPIEGEPDGATPIDAEDLADLKFKHITTRGELDEVEQANIVSGLQWLDRRRQNVDMLTEQFVRELHLRLFGDVWRWAGRFRRTEKNIGVDPLQIGVDLRMLLDDARFWVEHETYAPLEAGSRFHHRLVKIHCFVNGNGRHARIAADTYLKAHFDHPPIEWAAGEDLTTSNERRDEYIAALRSADAGDYEPLFRFTGVI